MIPILQTGSIDCVRACLASILEVDIELFPAPEPHHLTSFGAWEPYAIQLRDVLAELNICTIGIAMTAGAPFPNCYYIATMWESRRAEQIGPPTYAAHAVVAKAGEVIWDPSRSGVSKTWKEPYNSCVELVIPIDHSLPFGNDIAIKLYCEEHGHLRCRDCTGLKPPVEADELLEAIGKMARDRHNKEPVPDTHSNFADTVNRLARMTKADELAEDRWEAEKMRAEARLQEIKAEIAAEAAAEVEAPPKVEMLAVADSTDSLLCSRDLTGLQGPFYKVRRGQTWTIETSDELFDRAETQFADEIIEFFVPLPKKEKETAPEGIRFSKGVSLPSQE